MYQSFILLVVESRLVKWKNVSLLDNIGGRHVSLVDKVGVSVTMLVLY